MYRTIKKMIYLFDKKTRLQAILIFILMIVTAILETVSIGLIMPFIAVMNDQGIVESHSWLRDIKVFVGAKDQYEFLIFMSIGLVFLYTIKNMSLGLLNYAQLRFVFTGRSMLGKNLLKSYLLKPYTFHLERNSAELIRNIIIETIRAFNFVQSLLKLSSELCVFVCIAILLLWVNPMIVFISIGVLGFASAIYFKSVSNYLKTLGQKVQLSLKYTGKATLESLGAIKEVKISGCEDFFADNYFTHMMENARANWKYSTIGLIPRLSLEVVAVASVIIIIMLFQLQGKEIKALLPTLSLFAMATIRLMPSLSQIVSNLQSLRFDGAAVDAIYTDMKSFKKTDVFVSHEQHRKQKHIKFNNVIKIRNLSYIYPSSEKPSLTNISLDILKGQTIAFTGPSGAGKTTLANLILGLLVPAKGNIYVDDINIFEHLSEWQNKIGYVPQSIYLLDTTIKNNIAFGVEEKEIDDQKVYKALEIAQLERFVNELPEGLDTIIGENGVRLSGGQRQRVGIARALYHEPSILVMDEATSSLDGETEREVSKAIEILTGSVTLIVIAHRLSTIKSCDTIYYMEQGSVRAFGTFEKLLSKSVKFKRMVESSNMDVHQDSNSSERNE